MEKLEDLIVKLQPVNYADVKEVSKLVKRLLTGRGTVITARDALRWCCDAAVSRIIVKGPSEVLDVGRRTRTVTTAQRRALLVRDGGCVSPGCGMPAKFCDAHHIVPWVEGGPTSLENLELRCRRHHRAVHAGSDPSEGSQPEGRSPPDQ